MLVTLGSASAETTSSDRNQLVGGLPPVGAATVQASSRAACTAPVLTHMLLAPFSRVSHRLGGGE